MAKLLEGIKVIDLSRFLAGPYCASMLGDMGAEVIKVEPNNGEYLRHVGPFYEGESLYYMVMNRNKRGITLNTREAVGREILIKMFKSADVLVNNYKPGVMEKMGFTWEFLHELNPELILVSISGYGQTGTMASAPGFDSLAQAMFGLMSMTGPSDGEPYLAGSFLIDYATGIYAALGTMYALYYRKKTGEGQRVDTCLLDSAISLMVDAVPVESLLGLHRKRMGNLDRNSAPVGNFKTKDNKYVFVVAGPDNFYVKLMNVIGKPELIEDPRYKLPDDRFMRAQEINAIVGEWVAKHTRDEAVQILESKGIPVAPVLECWEAIQHPQVKNNQMVINFPYEGLGDIPEPGVPIKMSKTNGGVYRGAPRVGQHTDEVLSEYGFAQEEVAMFRERGIIR
jgi:crotonobetainyl-CoA:carnitine CoA-transferase CaiB-like acyl-CoA transferase